MSEFSLVTWWAMVGWFILVLVAAAVLTRLAYAMSEKISAAPALDFFISIFTWIPWVVGACCWGWKGLTAALAAEFFLLHIFGLGHRILRGRWGKTKGPTLTSAQNRILGAWINQIALFVQLPAVFVFVFIRAAEILLYPVIAALAKLPRYKQSEWVNLSRHKYDGLVGYDLLWCWYCDWMTGLWALGSEMLRNIESFWCPIQFQSPTKNQNATTDFPDVTKWSPPSGTMADAVRLLEKHYPGEISNSWWGHPDRNQPNQSEIE
ncbi:MAG: hypothetical protein V1746_06035 [bacterium]